MGNVNTASTTWGLISFEFMEDGFLKYSTVLFFIKSKKVADERNIEGTGDDFDFETA